MDQPYSVPDQAGFHAILSLRNAGRHAEAYEQAQTLRKNDDNAWDQMAAFISASGVGEWDFGYDAVHRAFDLAPIETYAEAVRNFSVDLVKMVRKTSRVAEMVDFLDRKWTTAPGMNLIPPQPGERARHDSNAQREEALARGLPSLLFIPMGGSASVSIGSMLGAGFRLPCVTYSLIDQRIVPSWAHDYQRGGALYVTHLHGEPPVIRALQETGPWRPVVHLRDPRQSFVSRMFFYLDGMPYLKDLDNTGFYKAERSRQIEIFIRVHWQPTIKWVTDWLEASRTLDVTFVHYEEFQADHKAYMAKVIKAAGAPFDNFDWSVLDSVTPSHFRKGLLNEWRELLTPEQIALLNQQITPEMKDRFNWHL